MGSEHEVSGGRSNAKIKRSGQGQARGARTCVHPLPVPLEAQGHHVASVAVVAHHLRSEGGKRVSVPVFPTTQTHNHRLPPSQNPCGRTHRVGIGVPAHLEEAHVRVAGRGDELLVRGDLQAVHLAMRVGCVEMGRLYTQGNSLNNTSSTVSTRSTYLRVGIAQGPGADARGRLPKADLVVVSRRRQDHRARHGAARVVLPVDGAAYCVRLAGLLACCLAVWMRWRSRARACVQPGVGRRPQTTRCSTPARRTTIVQLGPAPPRRLLRLIDGWVGMGWV